MPREEQAQCQCEEFGESFEGREERIKSVKEYALGGRQFDGDFYRAVRLTICRRKRKFAEKSPTFCQRGEVLLGSSRVEYFADG